MTIRARVQELEKQLEELKKEIVKQDKKEHKSLSDYRVYENLKDGEKYKYIDESADEVIGTTKWNNDRIDNEFFKIGNVYSYETPNELLEREIKKRQLWFALEKHLKEKNCLATNEDWKDGNRGTFTIHYDYDYGQIFTEARVYRKTNTIYSTNEEVLRNYMNTLSEEDIKIMFDVEE